MAKKDVQFSTAGEPHRVQRCQDLRAFAGVDNSIAKSTRKRLGHRLDAGIIQCRISGRVHLITAIDSRPKVHQVGGKIRLSPRRYGAEGPLVRLIYTHQKTEI